MRLRPALRGATFLGVAMIALTWASIGFDLHLEWRSDQQAAIQNTGNLARAFEEQIIRSIKEVDKTLLVLRAGYEQDPAHFDLKNSAKYFLGEVTPLFGLIDPHGMLTQSSAGPIGLPVDLSDREHYRALLMPRTTSVHRHARGAHQRAAGDVPRPRYPNPDGSFGASSPDRSTRITLCVSMNRSIWARAERLCWSGSTV